MRNYVTTTGKIPYAGFFTWYTITGDGDKTPLVALHGGPGAGSGYLHSLDPLSEAGRKIIYYDQLGCGRSPADSDPDRWSVEFFVEELKTVVKALGLDSFHLLGQSWGGMLAIHYAAGQPAELKSLILANTTLNMPKWDSEGARLAALLPSPHGEVLTQAYEAMSENNPGYSAALLEFNRTYLNRRMDLSNVKEEVPTEVNQVMEGDLALHTTGKLRDVDATGLLPRIKVPTLVLNGEYDQCTDAIVADMLEGLPNARAIQLKDSGHVPNQDAPEALNQVLTEFLNEVEK